MFLSNRWSLYIFCFGIYTYWGTNHTKRSHKTKESLQTCDAKTWWQNQPDSFTNLKAEVLAILRMRMRSHPVGLDDLCFVLPFVCSHTSCVRTAKALARLRGRAVSPEPSLVAYVISTIISWVGTIVDYFAYSTSSVIWTNTGDNTLQGLMCPAIHRVNQPDTGPN